MELAVFPVLDAGHTIATDGRRLPTVVIHAADVPAVADLARVHATDGVGDIWTEAVRSGDLLALGIKMTSPVRAAFAVAIDLSRFRGIVEDAAAAGALVIAHTDPGAVVDDAPTWLAVDLDGPALRQRLSEDGETGGDDGDGLQTDV